MRTTYVAALVAASLTFFVPSARAADDVAEAVAQEPAAMVTDQIPDIPMAMVEKTRPYMEFRTAGFVDWDPKTRAMLIRTRFANTIQLHRVEKPLGTRDQLTFADEPVQHASFAPDGSALFFQKDTGGKDRKSTRLNSSHVRISYAVFCL